VGGVGVDVAGDGGQGCSEFGWGLGLVGSGERDEHPVIGLGVEDGDADAFGCELVAVGVGDAADESGQAQPA
jgi:hypothetical protein